MAAEQLSVELVAEFVGRDAFEALKREVAQIKNSMNGLGEVQDRVRQQTDAAAGAVRQQRQALAQTGMQINQFAGQVAAGTPIMTAFVQQIGDVAYVIGQAGSAGGRLAAFLQGPWAAAILIGISVLGPLIAKLWESKDAAEKATSAFSKYMASLASSSKLSDVFTENSAKIATTSGEIAKLTKNIAALESSQKVMTTMGDGSRAAAAASGARLMGLKDELKAKQKVIDQLKEEIKNAAQAGSVVVGIQEKNKKIYNETGAAAAAAARKQEAAAVRAGKAAEKLRKQQEEIALEIRGFAIKDAADFGKAMEKMNDDAAKAINTTTSDVLQSTMSMMSDQFELMKKTVDDAVYRGADKVKTMSESMGQAFSDGIKGMITGAMSFKQVMINVIDSIISKLFEMFVVQQITGMIAKGIAGVTGITLPGKAIGGPVQAGKPYMVGERGPEMFVPSRSGSIVPNNNLGGGINISVDARGSADPAAVRQQVEIGIMQAAPYIIAAAQNKTLKTAGRTRLPGTIG